MNQVIIGRQLLTQGDIITSASGFGFSTDSKSYTDDILDKDIQLISGELQTFVNKSINIPKDRIVSYSKLPTDTSYFLRFVISVELNTPVDFYIIDGNNLNDYKYNVHVDATSEIQEYTASINDQITYICDRITKNNDFSVFLDNIDTDANEITVSLEVNVNPNANIKIVGKNVTNTTEQNTIAYINSENKVKRLLDKHIQQFGINHREYDNSFYESTIKILSNDIYNLSTLFTIRFKNPRVASVTHDEDLYQNVYILTTENIGTQLKTMFGIS